MKTFVEASLPSEDDRDPSDSHESQSPIVPAEQLFSAPEKGRINGTVAQIEAAYATQLANGDITQEQLQLIMWFFNLGKSEGMNMDQLSRKLGYNSETTVYRVFRGKYGAQLHNVLAKIADFKKLYDQRIGTGAQRFVATSLFKRVYALCDLTRTYQVINLIYGDPQTGKTEALLEYTRQNNHGQTIYVPMPPDGHYYKFLVAACKALRISSKGNSLQLEESIISNLTENMLLIIDELHQVCLREKSVRLNTIEFIRLGIFERVKCGIVLCGTNVFRDEMEKGRHAAIFEQTRRRGMATLQLPDMLPAADLDAMAATFGLSAAPEPIHELRVAVIKAHGLKAYMNFLRAGAKLAFNKGQSFEWSHFVAAHDALAKLKQQEGE